MQQQLHTEVLSACRRPFSRCYDKRRAMASMSSIAELWWCSGVSVDPCLVSAAGGSSSVNSQKK